MCNRDIINKFNEAHTNVIIGLNRVKENDDFVKEIVKKDTNITTSFSNDTLEDIRWEDLIKVPFDNYKVLENQGVKFKRIYHPRKECYFITEMDPDFSDKEYAYFGFHSHNCKEFTEIIYGHLIELVENRKEYIEGDIAIYPKSFKHKPISYTKSKYGVEFINPNV